MSETKTKHPNSRLVEAAKRLVSLGDTDGIFMTCESGPPPGRPCVRLRCRDLQTTQAVHRAIIDIVDSARGATDSHDELEAALEGLLSIRGAAHEGKAYDAARAALANAKD